MDTIEPTVPFLVYDQQGFGTLPTSNIHCRILVLGAGLVSQPCLDYLSRDPSLILTIADINFEAVDNLISSLSKQGQVKAKLFPLALDVSPSSTSSSFSSSVIEPDIDPCPALDAAISSHDLVISLLPVPFTLHVAKRCIACRRHLVHSSYASPQLKELDLLACQSNVIILCECGLDPGLDHITALHALDQLGLNPDALLDKPKPRITSFVSWCGALPSPQLLLAQNPLAYISTWSAKSLLVSSTASATYRECNQLIHVPGHSLWLSTRPVDHFAGYKLIGIPNRHSIDYFQSYTALKESATLFRGTLRFPGFSPLMHALILLQLIDQKGLYPIDILQPGSPPITWYQFIRYWIHHLRGQTIPDDANLMDPAALVRRYLLDHGWPLDHPWGLEKQCPLDYVIEILDWLGLFRDDHCLLQSTPIDALSILWQQKLSLHDFPVGDLILMHHIIHVECQSDMEKPFLIRKRYDMVFSLQSNPGEPSAIAKTVGTTVAIASLLLLRRHWNRSGVITPTHPEIYKPIYQALVAKGFQFSHTITNVS